MLDNRLKMVYELVSGKVLCDVGTDHAKLPVYAVLSGKVDSAYACDVKEGPLSSARSNIKANGLEDKITAVLSDGFRDIPQSDFDRVECFVLAGMGGELIMNILKARQTSAPLVLQPQSAISELYEFLSQNGYRVEKRRYCQQADKLYTAIRAVKDGINREIGLYDNSEQSADFYVWLEAEKKRCERAIAGIKSSAKPDDDRILEFENILNQIGKYI